MALLTEVQGRENRFFKSSFHVYFLWISYCGTVQPAFGDAVTRGSRSSERNCFLVEVESGIESLELTFFKCSCLAEWTGEDIKIPKVS